MYNQNDKSKRDLEYEMSRFEEEITKLAPPPPPPPPTTAPSAIAAQHKIKVQIPSSTFASISSAASQSSLFNTNSFSSVSAAAPSTTSSTTSSSQGANAPSGSNSNIMKNFGSQIKTNNTYYSNKTEPAPADTAATTSKKEKQPRSESESQAAKKSKGYHHHTPPSQRADATHNMSNKKKKLLRSAGGETWEDESLKDWDPEDFRIFCGDLGNEVTDEYLTRAFQKYPSFQRAKVIRDKRTTKSKGYGFVSFKDSQDFIKAMREMDGKYVGNRPIKLRKSNWRDRNYEEVKRREMEKQKMGLK